MNSLLRRVILNQTLRAYSINSNPESATAPNLKREKSLNLVQLIGRVGQDPKVSVNPNSNEKEKKPNRVMLFSLATNEYMGQDENDEQKIRVDWHRIAVFNPALQENVEKYVRQGDRLHVTGRIRYNLVKDKAGDERYVTSIVADDVIFLTKSV